MWAMIAIMVGATWAEAQSRSFMKITISGNQML